MTMLTGVNLSGAEWGSNVPGTEGVDYVWPTASELDYYKTKGLTLIRIPFLWERMEPTMDGPLNATYLGELKTFVADAAQRGMQVILDVHDYGRYYGNVIGSSAVPTSAFQDFWTKLAAQFSGNPGVYGYDLMNEPHDMPAGYWPADAQAAVNGIRSVDMKTQILVEGEGWSQAATWAQNNPNLNVKDPANHLIYEAHQYFDANNGGSYSGTYDQEGAYPNVGVDRVQPFINWLQQHNAQGMIGEFGVPGNDPRWLTVLDNFLADLKQHNISWTYFSGGPHEGGFPLSSISVEPLNGQDKPQMSVLAKYATDTLVSPGPTPAPTPAPTTGPDTLIVHASGDQWQGDPLMTVSVDGTQIGGTYDVSASHSAGQWQDITLHGNFAGAHQVQVAFTNDAYGGSPTMDRNLYVGSITLDGQTFAGNTATDTAAFGGQARDPNAAVMLVNGTATFNVATTGPDTLTVHVSGDQWQGDPLMTVSVDGTQIGGTFDVSASHSAGQWQDITVHGNFAGAHQVQVAFINDAYGGSSTMDRNLYVGSITLDGQTFAGNAATDTAAFGGQARDPNAAVMLVNGTTTFDVGSPVDTPSEARTNVLPGSNGVAQGTAANEIIQATASGQTLIGGGGDDIFQIGSHTDAKITETKPGISEVMTSASQYTLPNGIDNLAATGTSSHVLTGNAGNNVIYGSNANDALIAGTGNDKLVAGTGANMLTGGSGHDSFVFSTPSDHDNVISNFNTQTDVLDLRPLFHAIGYTGTDPVQDHFLTLTADGNGGTVISIDPDGSGPAQPHTLVTLQHVAPTALHAGADYLWH